MKALVTGSSGFIGKNFCEKTNKIKIFDSVFTLNSHSTWEETTKALRKSDILYHFAAVHRPKDTKDFQKVNVDYFKMLLRYLKENKIPCNVVITSSIQAGNNTPYGNSKIEAEKLLKRYAKETGCFGNIIRLTNCFGKYAKPNHHSVVATFCYNISHNIPIKIDNKSNVIELCYIDDVVNKLFSYVQINNSTFEYINKHHIYSLTVGELASILYNIKDNKFIPSNDVLINKLKETYEWYKQQK